MNFLNPLGFLGLLGIPMILLFYMLKQKHRELKVPSLFLWEKAYASSLAQRPWQKLRKNILLLLELLAVILLALALAGPVIFGGGTVKGYVLVLDQSFSMQATDETPSRFDKAKEEMKQFIQNAPRGTVFSIVAMGINPYIAASGVSDKNEALQALEEIQVTYGGMDADQTASLVSMEQEELKGAVAVFTDYGNPLPQINSETVLFGSSGENMAITGLTEADQTALVKVRNYGQQEQAVSVNLYTDEVMFNEKEITIVPGEESDVYFTGVPEETTLLKAVITNDDYLEGDNVQYYVRSNNTSERALLLTDQNIFLEKILNLLPSIQIFKGSGAESELSGFGLYIFDGQIPEKLPTDGHILIFHPIESNGLFSVDGTFQPGNVEASSSAGIVSNLKDLDIAVAESVKMDVPPWAETVLYSGENALLFAGEQGQQKIAAFGFDLHQSDLPLKKEYPVLMVQLMNWFFPDNYGQTKGILALDAVELEISPRSTKVTVQKPNGQRIQAAPPFPADTFTQTGEPGFYFVEETISEEENRINPLSVNSVTEGESNILPQEAEVDKVTEGEGILGSKDLKGIFILLGILLIAGEWWVSCRET